jgi:hypothetical protein
MVFIHCDNPVLRGQTLKGSIHIQAFTPYRAEKIHAELIRTEKYRGRARSCWSGICEVKTVEKVLVSAENVEITPPEHCIPFDYDISPDAPYSLMTLTSYIFYTIKVSVKKSRFFSEKGSERLVVLPHILESGNPPPIHKIPLPRNEISIMIPSMKPIHMWRYSSFTTEEKIHLQVDANRYVPRELLTGTIHFFKELKAAHIKIFLVYMSKPKKLKICAEKEILAVSFHDDFHTGSILPFSYNIPLDIYPDGETEHSEMYWIVRVVISNPLRFTKIIEKRITIDPLKY